MSSTTFEHSAQIFGLRENEPPLSEKRLPQHLQILGFIAINRSRPLSVFEFYNTNSVGTQAFLLACSLEHLAAWVASGEIAS
ncbi:hypothetical protein SBV1_620004 [Verrucomicrobia bacterium]|nr:hypothetical protein SBV1_620004 [Verrucomicrobiota bacterium]